MSIKEDVMNVDRQFCLDCASGKEKAWASYFAPDGFMVAGGEKKNIVGRKAIEEAMKSVFSLPQLEFIWEPDTCEVSDDGTLAVTKGTSKLSYEKDGQIQVQNGNYTTIWKYLSGSWKIAWDIGN